MSKAIGELMKTSCLKCGKSEGSSRDVNLVFQSDWLSGATCLNQSHSEVIYQTQTVPGLHLFLILYTDALRLNLNYSSFSSFNYYILTLFFPYPLQYCYAFSRERPDKFESKFKFLRKNQQCCPHIISY